MFSNVYRLSINPHYDQLLSAYWFGLSVTQSLNMLQKSISVLSMLLSSSLAGPVSVEFSERQSCPNLRVFGARETTAPAGYGSAGTVVNLVLGAHTGATAEAIDYPAAGGDSYGSSVQAGVKAVTSAVTSFAQQCPDTAIVLVGYSQVRTSPSKQRPVQL